ncbi:ABC transporter related protein [Thermobaculum terrenum ATCC BAA-798]|uniref:ABC transporter related protein n=1 Tax=Thermobaculum terrenum (strain ATCC BAA-798 / CCMEE 7001 / YNP1) TaxID=525904 RepID=D1CHC9_THET1|nr:daunorubicin resistance protein DrrA family ABC transporter ATP-binding protein [Thermobaculum terrenum]ACZ43150.1 ABC transporter related protein [Thermobaculum terrenum ATCC BAA-798]
MTAIIQVDGLSKSFGEVRAVNSISFHVEAGEVFGLLGPNGAGKSTTIKMLTTLLPPDAGRASIGGYDVVRHATMVRRIIGYVPQALSADGSLTGYENLLVFAKLYDIPRREREGRIREALKFMGLEEAADRLVRTYSGGMIRRLEIAQSMLHQPTVLFLDEPTIGLDPVARAAVWGHIMRLREEFGMTILLTTHYMEEADGLCRRIAIMHLGNIAAIGTPAELKASIGDPEATLDKVFVHYTGGELETGGSYREASRARRTARRLG